MNDLHVILLTVYYFIEAQENKNQYPFVIWFVRYLVCLFIYLLLCRMTAAFVYCLLKNCSAFVKVVLQTCIYFDAITCGDEVLKSAQFH